jgi:hypothetical protein
MYSRERVSKHKYNVDGSKIGHFFSWLGEEGQGGGGALHRGNDE